MDPNARRAVVGPIVHGARADDGLIELRLTITITVSDGDIRESTFVFGEAIAGDYR